MADNIQIANDDSTVVGTLASEDIGGIQFSVSKITLGAHGVNDGPVSAANPLPIAGAVSVSGVATAANQSAEIASLASIDGKTPALVGGAVPVSLPAGLATSAKQDTGNTSLASIDGKLPALGQAAAGGSVPVVLTAAQIATLAPLATVAVTGVSTATKQDLIISGLASIDGHVDGLESTLASLDAKTTAVNTGAVVIASSALPAGAATAARQDTGNASLASVDAKIPALGQAVAAASTPVVLTALQLATLTPPAAITGFATETTLAALNTKTPALGQAVAGSSVPIVLPAAQEASLKAPVLAAGTNIVGKVGIDQTTPGTTNGVQVNAALPVGANVIGKFSTDQTTHGTTDLVAADQTKIAGTAIDVNSGNKSNGTQRFVLATDQPALTTPMPTSDIPATAGGLSVSSFLSTAAVQSTSVKATPGQVYAMEFFNIGATPMYVRLYNQTGAPAAADNANIIWRGVIPGNTSGGGIVKSWEKGLPFSAGIGMRCTGGIADTDNTSLAASTVIGNIDYK